MTSTRYGLEGFLNDIDDSCHRIESYKFQAPGMFTNAIITKPSIMDLLKDAAEHEQALYRINNSANGSLSSTTTMKKSKLFSGSRSLGRDDDARDAPHINTIELKPERIDGKSIYVDQSFGENVAVRDDTASPVIRTAVKIPEIVKESWESQPLAQQSVHQLSPSSSSRTGLNRSDDPFTSPTKKSQSQQHQNQPLHYNLIPESVIQSDNVNEICNALLQLIAKYPTLVNRQDLYADINKMQQQHHKLSREIADLEDVVQQQRSQLNYHNVNMGEFSPGKKTKDTASSSQSESTEEALSIDELIQLEEAEIQQLEREVQEKAQ